MERCGASPPMAGAAEVVAAALEAIRPLHSVGVIRPHILRIASRLTAQNGLRGRPASVLEHSDGDASRPTVDRSSRVRQAAVDQGQASARPGLELQLTSVGASSSNHLQRACAAVRRGPPRRPTSPIWRYSPALPPPAQARNCGRLADRAPDRVHLAAANHCPQVEG